MCRGRANGSVAATALLAALIAACGSSGPEPPQGTVIVSIGDSVASGEGNPAPSGPRWENRACHRSATAGQTIAAREVQRDHPEIGFLDFACSGASIEKGLLGPYRGIEPALLQQPARPQIDEVRDASARAKDSGGLAAVMISIGANDVAFSKAVKFCTLVKHCWDQNFNPEFPFVEAGARYPTLEQFVNARLAELPASYNRLAAALGPVVPSQRVIIVDYFDPTTAADGSDCTILFGGVTPDESRWAREHVLVPLNAQVEAAAKAHGWNAVTGVAERFRGHGLCAGSQRWVRTLGEGLSGRPLPLNGTGVNIVHVQDVIGSTAGTLHPNEAGHRQIAALIAPLLAEVLNR
jgi:lysophospholipase L1-like esterase